MLLEVPCASARIQLFAGTIWIGGFHTITTGGTFTQVMTAYWHPLLQTRAYVIAVAYRCSLTRSSHPFVLPPCSQIIVFALSLTPRCKELGLAMLACWV